MQCLGHKTFDAILLDYDLDDGKGTALLPVLSALASRPVVIATSSHSEGNSKLLADGANMVCSKRDFGQIEQRLEQALEIIASRGSKREQTDPSSEFKGHSWDTLPEDIKCVCEPWKRIMREYEGDAEDWTGSSLENMVKRLFWLIPLAQCLQQRPALRRLYPHVHHAVLQLNSPPVGQGHFPFCFLSAESEGQFKLEYITGTEDTTHDAKRGNAIEIADLLELAMTEQNGLRT
jgi:hypothetical protein